MSRDEQRGIHGPVAPSPSDGSEAPRAAQEEVYRIQAARPGAPVKAIRAGIKGIAREAGRWVASAFEEQPMKVPAAVSGRLAVDRGVTPGALAMPLSGQAVPTSGRTWSSPFNSGEGVPCRIVLELPVTERNR